MSKWQIPSGRSVVRRVHQCGERANAASFACALDAWPAPGRRNRCRGRPLWPGATPILQLSPPSQSERAGNRNETNDLAYPEPFCLPARLMKGTGEAYHAWHLASALDDLERRWVFRPLIDPLVDNAPLHRHFPGQEVVALERVLDLLERLAGVLHVDLVETLLEIQDLLSMKHDVGRLALEAAGRLMQHDARVRECKPHSLLAGSQQQRCHGGGLADAQV